MKIYIVFAPDWEDKGVINVFANEKKARECSQINEYSSIEIYDVIE